MKTKFAVIALLICSLIAPTIAQNDATPATKGTDGPPTKTLAYDIRGLLQGMKIADKGGSPADMVDAYIKLIEDAVNPDTWKDNGGQIGMIRELNGLLVVT